MGQICWDFPLLGSGNESGSNIAAITMFNVGAGVMDSLAREVCQNSLDAKNKKLAADIPVRVKFELQYVKQGEFSMFAGYAEAINRSREYWENSPLKNDDIMAFLDYIECALSKEMVPVLVMSDYNTTGLRGVNASENEKSFWNLLVNTEGISIKEDKNSAGSYGIGKNAPFAYSALNLVFYNTLATDGGRAFEGVARLATTTRECGGKKRKTQPIGKYLFLENEYDWRPILPEDKCSLADLPMFERSDGEFGTDVAVFGFKEEEYSDWELMLASAVIKNFVIAIKDGKLEVVIKSEKCKYEISQNNIAEYLFDEFKEVPELKYTRQIYKTLLEYDKKVDVQIAEKDDLTIFVKYSETYSQSLSRFRSTGMLINTTTGDVLPHFSVVIIVNDVGEGKLSTTLRAAEPPQHTEWRAKHVKNNETLKNRAGRYIRAIAKEVDKVLDAFDPVNVESIVDAGLGSYLADETSDKKLGEGTDGLITDVKVSKITRQDGRVVYDSSYESATGATGKPVEGNAFKAGDKKRQKRRKKKLKPVIPGEGNKKGVAPGSGKVRVINPDVTDHRTFYLGGNRYRLFAECSKEYDNFYIQYFATRDDMSIDKDPLVIKSIKINDLPSLAVNSTKAGPFKVSSGDNTIHVEFENHELMAVTPVFTAEVKNEK